MGESMIGWYQIEFHIIIFFQTHQTLEIYVKHLKKGFR